MAVFNKRKGKTTTGLVWSNPGKNAGDVRHALLYDFDIDDDELKPEHRGWLIKAADFLATELEKRKKQSLPAWVPGSKPLWRVYIQGYTSKTGSKNHNQALSALREQSVEEFLRAKLEWRGLPEGMVEYKSDYYGYDRTTVEGEHEQGRSVDVTVQRPTLPPPILALPPKAAVPEGSKRFAVRLVFEGEANIPGTKGIGTGEIWEFDIADMDRKKITRFTYRGMSMSMPLPGAPISFQAGGKFESFRTTKPVSWADFEGDASIYSAPGVGPVSLGPTLLDLNTFAFLKKGVSTVPRMVPIDSPMQYKMSLGGPSTGKMKWSGVEKFYSGPY